MARWRPAPVPPDLLAERNRERVTSGTPAPTRTDTSDTGDISGQLHSYTSPQAILERLGPREAARALAEADQAETARATRQGIERKETLARSPRTLRRWRREGRVPSAKAAMILARADQIQRAGGIQAAADRWGRTPATVRDWARNPARGMLPDATRKQAQQTVAEIQTRSGIPTRKDGRVAKPARVRMRGKVWAQGASGSPTYGANRSIDLTLDLDTTQSMLDASNAGEPGQVQRLFEDFYTEHYTHLDQYDDQLGWHIESIDDWHIEW